MEPLVRGRVRRDHRRRSELWRPGSLPRSHEGREETSTMAAMTVPLIPSTVIGSHGRAGWWHLGVKAWEAGEMGPGDLEEMLDDAADTAIRDMETAGLDLITDGEVRRLDGYVDSYYAIIKGIKPIQVRRKLGPWGYDQQTRYEAVGRIETPDGGLGIVKEFEYLKAHTVRGIKATCAGPLT